MEHGTGTNILQSLQMTPFTIFPETDQILFTEQVTYQMEVGQS